MSTLKGSYTFEKPKSKHPIDLPKWVERECKSVRMFQLGDDPELLYIIPHDISYKNPMCIVVSDDAYGNGGKAEYMYADEIKKRYQIEICQDCISMHGQTGACYCDQVGGKHNNPAIKVEKPKKDWKCRIFRIKFGFDTGQWFVQVFDKHRHLKRARHSKDFWYCLGVLWGK